MSELERTWNEAIQRLPRKPGETILSIRFGYDFEPHGKASETWEDVWKIELKTVPGYWMSTTGWRRGKFDEMSFKGKTEAECKLRAISFIEWWNNESKQT